MHLLTPLFDWILAVSARAALLAVVVLMVQAVLGHRVSARWRYALWLPVLIVLLTPAFPENSWSVSSITHLAPAPLRQVLVVEQLDPFPTPPSLPAPPSETTAPIAWRQIICLAWLIGAAGMMLFSIAAYAHTLSRFKRSLLPVSDALQRELAVVAREIRLRRLPRVWVASAIRSPAVTGLLRPTLLLPAPFEQTLTPHEARLVLQHELTHLKRGDLPVNALLCLLLALHWFNPLLWLAFFKARLDREAACDAHVLDREDQSQRVAYGHTLLKVESAFSHHGLSRGFVGIFQRGAALRARIRSIAAQPKPHPLMKAALSLSLVLLTFIGITRAATTDAKAPQILIQSKFVEVTERDPERSPRAPLPAPLDGTKKHGLVATLTDPQYQGLIRALSQQEGVDLMAASTITTRSGQQGRIEIVREFVSPDEAGKQVVRNPGVTLTVLPKMTAENQINLDLSPQVTEFEGFAAPKKKEEAAVITRKIMHADGTTTESVSDGEKGEVSESKFSARGVLLSKKTVPSSEAAREPIFTVRKIHVDAAITSGQTIVLEMDSRTDKQLVQETNENGDVVSSKTVLYHRRLFVFVTADLVDPVSGKLRAP